MSKPRKAMCPSCLRRKPVTKAGRISKHKAQGWHVGHQQLEYMRCAGSGRKA